MKKAFYFDVETTGLKAEANGLTQIACIVEYGDVKDELVLNINPYTYNKSIQISDEALEVTNKTREDLQSYPSSKEQFKVFIEFLDKHIDKYNKSDKFHPIGYNSTFDMQFLMAWFVDNNNNYFGSYFYYGDIDVYKLYSLLLFEMDLPKTTNRKLSTLCEEFGIELNNAHDALDDIKATKNLYEYLKHNFISFKYKDL